MPTNPNLKDFTDEELRNELIERRQLSSSKKLEMGEGGSYFSPLAPYIKRLHSEGLTTRAIVDTLIEKHRSLIPPHYFIAFIERDTIRLVRQQVYSCIKKLGLEPNKTTSESDASMDRVDLIYRLREQGHTFAQIGKLLNISATRVNQIYRHRRPRTINGTAPEQR